MRRRAKCGGKKRKKLKVNGEVESAVARTRAQINRSYSIIHFGIREKRKRESGREGKVNSDGRNSRVSLLPSSRMNVRRNEQALLPEISESTRRARDEKQIDGDNPQVHGALGAGRRCGSCPR